jgi:DNA-binding MarR family transcriptional regulator
MESIIVSMETIHRRPHRGGSSPQPDLESHLGYWLRRVSNHVSGAFARGLQMKHTSVAEWVVLCCICDRPGISPGVLAETLDLTRGAVSKVIDKLEAKNWITRSTKPEDSRLQLLSMTRSGNRVLPQLAKIADENDREFFAVLDPAESATLRRLLGKLAEFHKIRAVPTD